MKLSNPQKHFYTIKKQNEYGERQRYFSVKLDQMEEERHAVSKAAEERAKKYSDLIQMTRDIHTNVNDFTNGMTSQFDLIKNRFE